MMKVLCYNTLNETKLIDKYRSELSHLIVDYYTEVHFNDYRGSLNKALRVLEYWSSDYFVYFVVDDREEAVGFLILSVNNQLEMTRPYLVVDYMYVSPPYRGTKATQWLFITIDKVARDLDMDVLGTTLAGSSNNHNCDVMNGEVIATIRCMRREAFKDKSETYNKRLKIKKD